MKSEKRENNSRDYVMKLIQSLHKNLEYPSEDLDKQDFKRNLNTTTDDNFNVTTESIPSTSLVPNITITSTTTTTTIKPTDSFLNKFKNFWNRIFYPSKSNFTALTDDYLDDLKDERIQRNVINSKLTLKDIDYLRNLIKCLKSKKNSTSIVDRCRIEILSEGKWNKSTIKESNETLKNFISAHPKYHRLDLEKIQKLIDQCKESLHMINSTIQEINRFNRNSTFDYHKSKRDVINGKKLNRIVDKVDDSIKKLQNHRNFERKDDEKVKNLEKDDYSKEFNDLKMQVTSSQADNLDVFMKNLQEPAENFKFDIEKYLNSNKKNSNQYQGMNSKDFNKFIKFDKDYKRDILTQRIKAISNKMRFNSFLDQPEILENDSIENDKKSSRSNKGDENDFIDKYYLLNDGKFVIDSINHHKDIQPIDPVGINIDLDLDKKFRDLKFNYNKDFYSGIEKEKTTQL